MANTRQADGATGQRWFALAVLLFVILGSAFATANRITATAVPSNPDAIEYAKKFGVTIDEAEARIGRQPAIGALNARLAEAFPSSFAGLWIENQPNYRVVVAFTDPNVRMESIIKESDLAWLVEVQFASYSLQALEQFQGNLQARLEGTEATVDIDVPRNGLLVEATGPLSLAEHAAALGIAEDGVSLRLVASLPTAATIIHGGGDIGCTSGFGVKKSISGVLWKGFSRLAIAGMR